MKLVSKINLFVLIVSQLIVLSTLADKDKNKKKDNTINYQISSGIGDFSKVKIKIPGIKYMGAGM